MNLAFSLATTLALSLVLSFGLAANAQAAPIQSSAAQAQTQPQQKAAQTFTGEIWMSSGEYVFVDQSTNAVYKLNNQDKAKEFAGKAVKITGTLDARSKTIEVQDIQPAA